MSVPKTGPSLLTTWRESHSKK